MHLSIVTRSWKGEEEEMEYRLVSTLRSVLIALILLAGCARVPLLPKHEFPGSSWSTLKRELERPIVRCKPEKVYLVAYEKPELAVDTSDHVLFGGVVEDQSLVFGSLLDSSSTHPLHAIDAEGVEKPNPSWWKRLSADQLNFYSRESLLSLGLVFATGATVANTDTDAQLQRHFQASIRGASSREWFDFFHANKELGNGVYTLPVMGAAWLANEYIDGPPAFEGIGLWGERSVRGFLLGAPPLVVTQRLTGGSRPYENEAGSEWHPFRDNNGVSGHAFMSSLPFITAAKMTDNPWQKSFWYLSSTIGPLSRVNDNAHYPSQVGLGWALAFLSATAVQQTDTGKRGWTLLSHSPTNETGFAMQYRW